MSRSIGHMRAKVLWEKIGQLVVASLYFFEVVGIEPHTLAKTCFASYIEGLRAAGWAEISASQCWGFAVDSALRTPVGLLPVILPLVNRRNES